MTNSVDGFGNLPSTINESTADSVSTTFSASTDRQYPYHHQQQNQQNQPERPPIPPELNELICRATGRVMPRFEALLRSMAAPDVDIRVLEARVGALVSACWALVAPFAVASPEWKGQLEELIGQMDIHLQALQVCAEI